MGNGRPLTQVIHNSLVLYLCLAVLGLILVFQIFTSPAMQSTTPVTMEVSGTPAFPKKFVHFDLKGAPPRIAYFAELLPLLRHLRVDGIVMEYEDMFPYVDSLALLRKRESYSVADIATIIKLAEQNNLEVVPLVQTFGHLEFMLKHDKFSHLREDPNFANTICPSSDEAFSLISEMLQQVRNLHPNSKTIHIGADEAYNIAKDARCQRKLREDLESSVPRLKLWHISRVARKARELGFEEVWAWNDMFGDVDADLMKEYEMGTLLTPVVWGYARDVTVEGYFPSGMFDRYAQVFKYLMFGSAYKGANGMQQTFIDVERYLANQMSYVNLHKINSSALEGRVQGIILTGWQRFSHLAPLCELLPVGIPSLVLSLHYLNNTSSLPDHLAIMTQETLGCRLEPITSEVFRFGNRTYVKPLEAAFVNGNFPGSQIFDMVEELRFLTWRVHNLPKSESFVLRAELEMMEKKIRDMWRSYFYDDSIEEFIMQNIFLLKQQTQ